MSKKILKIDEKHNLDIFSYAEENLFIDLLIKADDEARKKASEYAWYLEELKKYVKFENEKEVNEIIEFLKSKSSLETNKEEKRKYMEMKFELLDNINDVVITNGDIYWNDVDDFWSFKNTNYENKKLIEYLKEYFPIIKEGFEQDIFLWDYFSILSRSSWEEKMEAINLKNIKNEFEDEFEDEYGEEKYKDYIEYNFTKKIDELENKKFLLIPVLFPIWKEWGNWNKIEWKIKTLKFTKLKSEWEDNENMLSIFNKFILLEEDLKHENKIISEIFPKTNLFCDYRFFDRSMFN